MVLLGLISLAQIWFIPGYLLLYRTQDILRLDKLLLAIPLSAVINFFLVYALVLLGIYKQQVVIAIFTIEIITYLFFIWKKSKQTEQTHPASQVQVGFDVDFTNVIFALFVLLYACQFINQIGTVFTQGDAVMSWNPWAISWFNGVIPSGVAWYPQLLPTLYSLTYQFMGDSRIELAAKIAVSFYPLVAFAIVSRIAAILSTERKKILWSAIIFFLLVRRLWGLANTVNGYADFPLAFFCISILYVFALKATEPSRKVSPTSITLAAILIGIAIGAGLMKQSGVFLGMLIPFFWLAYFRNEKSLQTHIKQSATIGIAIALGLATWYLYQYWRISSGIETSNLSQLSSIVKLPWDESIVYGFKGITRKLSWLWVLLFLAALAHRQVRYIALCAVAPFFLLWAAFVPYDYRNLAAVFPILAVSLSYGWAELACGTRDILAPYVNLQLIQRAILLIVLVALSTAVSSPKLNDELLILSNKAKGQIGDTEINSRLAAYFEFHPEPSRVATPYSEMGKLPNMSERYSPLLCRLNYATESTTLESILSQLSDPVIRHVLLLYWCDARVLEYFASKPDHYHMVFRIDDAVFYEINSRR